MKTSGRQTQHLLLIGFGGLLLLLAFTGLNGLSVLAKIQTRNDHIRRDYFNRDRILERLSSDILPLRDIRSRSASGTRS